MDEEPGPGFQEQPHFRQNPQPFPALSSHFCHLPRPGRHRVWVHWWCRPMGLIPRSPWPLFGSPGVRPVRQATSCTLSCRERAAVRWGAARLPVWVWGLLWDQTVDRAMLSLLPPPPTPVSELQSEKKVKFTTPYHITGLKACCDPRSIHRYVWRPGM
jgi:hypothetical protein